jgi:hypothetical protein
MKVKSETMNLVMQFITSFGATVKIIRSDNGVEFLMPEFYSSKAILHQLLGNAFKLVMFKVPKVICYLICILMKSFVLAVSSTFEPKTYAQAVKHDCQKETMNKEIHAFEQNNNWLGNLLMSHLTRR